MIKEDKTKQKDVLMNAQSVLEEYEKKLEGVKNYSSAPEMSVNPFIVTLNDSLKIAYRKDGNAAMVKRYNITDSETGELISDVRSNITFQKRQYVDNQEFIKIYSKGFADILGLSHGALKVFFYFMSRMQQSPDSDLIWYDIDECQADCDYDSHRMVYDSIAELIKKKILCRSDKNNRMWINPQYVFNGNRIYIFSEFINKDDDHFKGKKSLKR